jgi:pyridinium-3,5-biscarboxylic acid mononucleotide synthase
MYTRRLRELLRSLQSGAVSVDEAVEALAYLPYEDIGEARIDHHRSVRQGRPEVVFGEGKSPEQIAEIVLALLRHSPRAMVTRAVPDAAERLLEVVPDALYHPAARLLIVDREPLERVPGVCVVSAGTSDLPVAEEAALTAETMGNGVDRVHDVGVAGLHRVLDCLPTLRRARAVVVVAGMDGALPSVVGGLVSAPVIAVPTSVGYGASFGGIAALLTMLNSCAPGVSVVNIDNGFGAGVLAAMINRGRMD